MKEIIKKIKNSNDNCYYIFVYVFLLLIGSCSNPSINVTKEHSPLETEGNLLKQRGMLSIQFISDDNVLFEKVNIKLSKVIPIDSYIKKIVALPIIIGSIPIVIDTHDNPVVNRAIIQDIKQDILTNKEYFYFVDPGEYFISLDNIDTDRLKFQPTESKIILFMFGYSLHENKIFETKASQKCKSTRIRWRFDRTGKDLVECQKIQILRNKKTIIKVNISNLLWNNFGDIFDKFFPGLFILGPFTNYSYYFHRDYDIEIITEDILNNE